MKVRARAVKAEMPAQVTTPVAVSKKKSSAVDAWARSETKVGKAQAKRGLTSVDSQARMASLAGGPAQLDSRKLFGGALGQLEPQLGSLPPSTLSLRNALALVEAKRALPYSPSFTYFGERELRALSAAVLMHLGEDNYKAARPRLLASLPASQLEATKKHDEPRTQVALDLATLNRIHTLPDGTVPLREYLAALGA